MANLTNVFDYIIGTKSTGGTNIGGVPINVKVSLDPDLKSTVLKTTGIIGFSLFLGVVTGIYIADKKKR
jgi:hypothetical protein